jgi:hypothetical protein
MSTSFDWSKYEKETPEFDWAKYEKEEPSRARSLISAPIKGALKSVQDINPFFHRAVGPELSEKLIQKFLPTQEKTAEQVLETAGSIAPLAAFGAETIPAKLLQVLGGTAAGELARANEASPIAKGASEALGMGLPGLLKGTTESLIKAVKSPVQTLKSGLTKPVALESKYASKGVITPAQQEKSIRNINEEAAKIGRKTAEEHVPLIKKLEEGHDFEKEFQKGFGKLESATANNEVGIDIAPLQSFLTKSSEKYEGIPNLHEEGKKVLKEIKSFNKNPQTHLDKLIKIYRSNNKKIKNIYETSRTTGKQQEYVDFLVDMNREIVGSLDKSLPKDSLWLKEFKKLNSDYRNYKNSIKALDLIEPILGKKATPAALEKLASDKTLQKKLSMSLGEEGADKIIGLAKDQKSALDAINSIPAKELKTWETLLPLSIFIPHTHGIGAVISIKKGFDLSRRVLGYILTSPARQKEYRNVLKSIIEKDKAAYAKSSKKLLDSLESEE